MNKKNIPTLFCLKMDINKKKHISNVQEIIHSRSDLQLEVWNSFIWHVADKQTKVERAIEK
jgi:hypothetical protein